MLIILLLFAARIVALSAERTMHCCTLEAAPYVMKSSAREKDGYDGVSIEYFARVQERTGLRCGKMEFYSFDGTTGWTHFIEKMADCSIGVNVSDSVCKCDVGVGAWYEHEDRRGVDFLPSHVFDGLKVLVHKNNTFTSSDEAFFLKAYSSLVWFCIFALIVIFALLKVLDKRFEPAEEFKSLSGKPSWFLRMKHVLLKHPSLYRLRRALQSTTEEMLQQPTSLNERQKHTTRQWVLSFVIMLCGIFLVLTYEASMTASLVLEETVSEFRNVDDFKNCTIRDSEICFVNGDIIQTYWNKAFANSECRKGKSVEVVVKKRYSDLIEAIVNKECKYALVDGGTALNYANGRYCGKVVTTGEAFNKDGLAAVLPKNSSFREELARATLELRGQDALEDSIEKYYKAKMDCQVLPTQQLDLRRLRVFFIVAFAVCGLIFIEMCADPQSLTRVEKEFQMPTVVSDSSRDGDEESEE